MSYCEKVLCAKTQGSVIRPIFYLFYMNLYLICAKLTRSCPLHFLLITNLFMKGKYFAKTMQVLELELHEAAIWFRVNKLSLDTTKANYMI